MADYAIANRALRAVTESRDWPHSSFHPDVHAGIFPKDWAGDVDASGEFGER